MKILSIILSINKNKKIKYKYIFLYNQILFINKYWDLKLIFIISYSSMSSSLIVHKISVFINKKF